MILALVEHDKGVVNPLALGMLNFAKSLAAEQNCALEAVLVGEEARSIASTLGAFGVTKVHMALHDGFDDYSPEAWAQAFLSKAETGGAKFVLSIGTDRGNEVMAHVAARTNQSMVANIISYSDAEMTRLRWGGSLLEESTLADEMKLMTVAPHTFPTEEEGSAVEVTIEDYSPEIAEKDFRVKISKRIVPEADGVSLTDAEVVISGGRGVGSEAGFSVLEDLASTIGGAVGCSRAVTSLGWRPHSDQVGQTGTRVAAELYIACGISGAAQHMAGCKGSKNLLAINTDPDAPILQNATYAVIGDLHDVLPAINAEIKKVTG